MKIIQKAGPEVLVLISLLNVDSIALIEMVKIKRYFFHSYYQHLPNSLVLYYLIS